jgi:hypothetical protein
MVLLIQKKGPDVRSVFFFFAADLGGRRCGKYGEGGIYII